MKRSFKVRLLAVINHIHRAFVVLALTLLVLMTIIISVNVFMRYVLNSGLYWAEEVVKLALAWFTFISMAVGVKEGLHISLQLLPRMQNTVDRVLTLLKDLLILGIGLIMIIIGARLIGFTSSSIMPATAWPSSTLYFILPFAGLLVSLEALLDLFNADTSSPGFDESFLEGPQDTHA